MSTNPNSTSNDLILTTISLDEPTQLLTILFDVSSSWYTQLNTHIPLQHRPYQRQILSQLYFDTISQICIFINTLLALNKRNLIHFIAISDDRSIVLQQALVYPSTSTTNTQSTQQQQQQSDNTNTTTPTHNQSSILFPNINWVNPDDLPRPTQANDQLFGTTTSDLFSKLILLNPFQKPLEDYIAEQQENIKRTTNSTTNQNQMNDNINTTSTQSNINNPPPNSFGRLLTGALTKALCYINKAKKYDQSISPRILIFSLSQFQPSSAYMNCALVAAKFNCLIDTLCINHGFNNYELQQEEFKEPKFRLSNLLQPIIQQTIIQNKSTATTPTTSTPSKTTDMTIKALEMIKPPRTLPTLSCHCEPHQQSSHITNGCSLFISESDMNTLIQFYTITYSPLSTLNQQSSLPSTTMSDSTTLPLPPTSLDELYMNPQEYLYLLTLLQTHCLSSETIRHHLITPIQTSVTLTSPCFCHPTTLGSSSSSASSSSSTTSQQQQINAIQHSTLQKTQPPRYLCNVCLVVVCQQFAQCPNCKSRFVMQKSAIQLNRNTTTTNNTTTNTKSTTSTTPTTNQTTQQPLSTTATTTQPTTTVKINLPKPQGNIKPGKININIGKK